MTPYLLNNSRLNVLKSRIREEAGLELPQKKCGNKKISVMRIKFYDDFSIIKEIKYIQNFI